MFFGNYLDTQEPGTPLWWSVLEYSQILAEFADRDFGKFCKLYEQYVTHQDYHLCDAAEFEFPLTEEYTLYLSTLDSKVTRVRIGHIPFPANAICSD